MSFVCICTFSHAMSLVSQEIRAVALADELSLTIKIVVIEGKCVIFFICVLLCTQSEKNIYRTRRTGCAISREIYRHPIDRLSSSNSREKRPATYYNSFSFRHSYMCASQSIQSISRLNKNPGKSC
jgi:hypothetical protein